MDYIAELTPLQISRLLDGMDELDAMTESKMKKRVKGGKKNPLSKSVSSAKDIISQLKQVPGTKIIRKKRPKRKK